jgi:hypothetical protein
VDGGFLSGLIEAEGSFSIAPNNGGQNWRFGLTVAMRDDDAPVLTDLHAKTRLGHFVKVRARGNSKPQVAWTIESRTECLRLTEILQDHPLYGRKSLEVEVWAHALHELERGADDSALPQAASDIRRLRRYGNRSDDRPPDLDARGFSAYFGGFFTGEGHLLLRPDACRVVLKLRDDDRPLLDAIASHTGIGRVYAMPATATSRPAAAWIVYRHTELAKAVELLENAGLRGRKQREFAEWRKGALEYGAARSAGRRRDTARIADACAALVAARRYEPPIQPLPASFAGAFFTETCVSALRHSSGQVEGPLTSTAYMQIREAHPDWPDRNSMVRAFGSWANALELADLSDRTSARALATRAERRTPNGAQLARQAEDCRRVLTAVSACARELGREPKVAEYLEWRAAGRTDLPSLAKTHRLFPDGWASVLRLAEDGEAAA